MNKSQHGSHGILAENRRARFDYQLLDTYEAGMELLGAEVKSVRSGSASLSGAYAIIRGREVYLINCQIPPYQPKNMPDGYDPLRTRRLLLTAKEIAELTGKFKEKGIVLVATKIFTKHNRIKVELAVAKPRKAHDKREYLKAKEARKEMKGAAY